MTLVIYEPEGPALEFIGHAGAGLYGRDPVCAALSILMYTLIEAVPTAAVTSGDGYCRIDASTGKNQTAAQHSGCGLEKEEGGSRSAAFVTPHGSGAERASSDAASCRPDRSVKQNIPTIFDTVLGGLRLLAGSFPQYVRLEEKK